MSRIDNILDALYESELMEANVGRFIKTASSTAGKAGTTIKTKSKAALNYAKNNKAKVGAAAAGTAAVAGGTAYGAKKLRQSAFDDEADFMLDALCEANVGGIMKSAGTMAKSAGTTVKRIAKSGSAVKTAKKNAKSASKNFKRANTVANKAKLKKANKALASAKRDKRIRNAAIGTAAVAGGTAYAATRNKNN